MDVVERTRWIAPDLPSRPVEAAIAGFAVDGEDPVAGLEPAGGSAMRSDGSDPWRGAGRRIQPARVAHRGSAFHKDRNRRNEHQYPDCGAAQHEPAEGSCIGQSNQCTEFAPLSRGVPLTFSPYSRKMTLGWISKLAVVCLGWSMAVAHASIIAYVSDGSKLYSINPVNASVLSTQTLSIGGLQAMAFNSQGALFGLFDNAGQGTLALIDPSTGNVSLFGQTAGAAPLGLAFDSAGGLFGRFGDTITGIDPNTGGPLGDFACNVGGASLAFGPDALAWLVHGAHLLECPSGFGCGSEGVTG